MVFGALVPLGCRSAAVPPPDVVVITLDTTRADHLGAYGYTRAISPSLDAFARDAVVFRNAWSTSSWTLPAHASIFTGKHPTSHGAHHNLEAGDATLADVIEGAWFKDLKVNRLPEHEVTLAELLRERGYATAAIVGGPWLAPPFGLLQGYELQDADVKSTAGRSAQELTDRARSWLQSIPRGQALHLLVNYFDPHEPYAPPPGFDDLPRARTRLPVRQRDINKGRPLKPMERDVFVDRYDGEIRFMDHHFGRLMETLRELGRYENALIIVVGDHGELLGEHGFIGHGRWLYEELLRVSVFVRFPRGRRAGTTTEAPVSVVDLLPLIAKELDLPLPPAVEGVWVGDRRVVLAEIFRNGHSLKHYGPRFDRDLVAFIRWPWKLIVSDRGERELFRLDTDPAESRDRAGAEVEAELLRELEQARAALSAPKELTVPRGVDPSLRDRLRGLGYIE
jgi:arylsulfatase